MVLEMTQWSRKTDDAGESEGETPGELAVLEQGEGMGHQAQVASGTSLGDAGSSGSVF